MTAVGVPLRPFVTGGVPPKLALNRAYFQALEDAGADVVPIPVVREVERVRFHYELVDALLLPGGADVEPRRYGAAVCDECNLTVMPELDEMELQLAGWAIAEGKPVLGICRGIQVLNVACGGTLWQDLRAEGAARQSHDRESEPRDLLAHDLEVEPDSGLARVLGTTRIKVNSLHHQAIRDLAPTLRAVARSDDGLIEGVELPGHPFALGIQCHPEELAPTERWARRLFAALVEAGAEHARERRLQRAMGIEPT